MQYAGYAARVPDHTSEFIWLHPVQIKGEKNSAPITEPSPSQLCQVINIHDDTDLKSEVDEEKQKEQIKKKQENKKTLKDLQAAIEDTLYQMINEPGCVRKIIFSALDKPDLQDFDK